MGELVEPAQCLVCGVVLFDAALHARWHEGLVEAARGDLGGW